MDNVKIIERADIEPLFPPRAQDANKGDFGRALLLCGSYGMAGAAILAGRACVLSGAGLTHLVCPQDIYPILAGAMAEPIFTPLRDTFDDLSAVRAAFLKADAALIGCGLGQSDRAASLFASALSCADHTGVPLVIDADGINLLSHNIQLLQQRACPIVLTPHPGEMARLCGLTAAQVQQSRRRLAREFAVAYNVTVVLKGHQTVVATPQELFVNLTGNPGMATGGSGDMLAGMLVSFLAQGMSARDAAAAAVYLHGLAGDRGAAQLSQHSLTPSAMLSYLPQIFLEMEQSAMRS